MKRRAYTLVEILLVLVIVAVLSALLWGVFARVREKGHQTTCTSNLRQMGMVIQQYVQENDGTFPTIVHYNDLSTQGLFANRQILWCPSSNIQPYGGSQGLAIRDGKFYPWPPPASVGDSYGGFVSNYRYNVTLLNAWKPNNPIHGHKESSFADANLIVAFDEADDFQAGSTGHFEAPLQVEGCLTGLSNPQLTSAMTVELIAAAYCLLHSGGANYLFADGHVKWLKPQAAAEAQCEAAHLVPAP